MRKNFLFFVMVEFSCEGLKKKKKYEKIVIKKNGLNVLYAMAY